MSCQLALINYTDTQRQRGKATVRTSQGGLAYTHLLIFFGKILSRGDSLSENLLFDSYHIFITTFI